MWIVPAELLQDRKKILPAYLFQPRLKRGVCLFQSLVIPGILHWFRRQYAGQNYRDSGFSGMDSLKIQALRIEWRLCREASNIRNGNEMDRLSIKIDHAAETRHLHAPPVVLLIANQELASFSGLIGRFIEFSHRACVKCTCNQPPFLKRGPIAVQHA